MSQISESPAEDVAGISFRAECYQAKKPEGCHKLAMHLASLQQDVKAKRVFKMNCEDNRYGDSCLKLGNMFYHGRGGERDLDKACEHYLEGCNKDSGDACNALAFIHRSVDSKKDIRKATVYLQEACKKGSLNGCHELSGIYLQGAEGIPKNMFKAYINALKGCKGGYIRSCVILSQMYTEGQGVEQNRQLGQGIKEEVLKTQSQMREVAGSLDHKDRVKVIDNFRQRISDLLAKFPGAHAQYSTDPTQ